MSQGAPQPVPPPLLQRGLLQAGSPLDEQRLIAHVLRYCTSAGYALPPLLVLDYIVALKSSPFVLLFGPSGQGKTEVARLFAQALTAPFDDQYAYINLGAVSSQPFVHLQDRFGWLKFIEMLETAAAPENAGRVFFLCLDNLRPSDVATYFATFTQRPEEANRMAMRGYPLERWLQVPANVVITGTLDADAPLDAKQSTLLADINCVYVQPHWLAPGGPAALEGRQPIAPVGFQHVLLQSAVRTEEGVMARLQALLGEDVDEIAQPPAELTSILWQAGLTYDKSWRSATLRTIANSFTSAGQGLFAPHDSVANTQFALVFALARQMMLRLWGQPNYQHTLEAMLKHHIDQLAPIIIASDDVLSY